MLSRIQKLLNKEATLANRRRVVQIEIKKLRGTEPPFCWGNDDCSTMMLSQCAWRNDCGTPKSISWQTKSLQCGSS